MSALLLTCNCDSRKLDLWDREPSRARFGKCFQSRRQRDSRARISCIRRRRGRRSALRYFDGTMDFD